MARIANDSDGDAPDATEFSRLLAMRNVVPVLRPEGYLIFRVAGPEADIEAFTIATDARGRGIGTRMLQDGLAQLHDLGVREVFLEVDTGNLPALKLYTRAGFFIVGRRPGYYRLPDRSRRDAYSMAYYYGKEDLIDAKGRYRLSL